MDWKEKLSALATPQETNASDDKKETLPGKGKMLYIRYEKRNGKPATIISEFDGSDEALKSLAKSIKSTLGVGGSAKDDEILLQGDVRKKLSLLLKAQGYKLKGEV